MNHYETMAVGEIVTHKFACTSVFQKYHIDFCCGGNTRLADAAQQQGIPLAQIVAELNAVDNEKVGQHFNFNDWSLELLCDYVLKYHHPRIRAQGPIIKQHLDKIVTVHGKNHPSLLEVKMLFDEALVDLESHLMKEENILFPYIYGLVTDGEPTEKDTPCFGTVRNPVRMMMHEHDQEGERFRKIEQLTDGYTPPEDACNTYRFALSGLKAFQDHLHEHIHIENNMIFPQAINLERAQGRV